MKCILLSFLLIPAFLHAEDTPRQPVSKDIPTQWEYSVITAWDADGETEHLTKLGMEGWELISVVFVDGLDSKPKANKQIGKLSAHLRYYLKRQKSR